MAKSAVGKAMSANWAKVNSSAKAWSGTSGPGKFTSNDHPRDSKGQFASKGGAKKPGKSGKGGGKSSKAKAAAVVPVPTVAVSEVPAASKPKRALKTGLVALHHGRLDANRTSGTYFHKQLEAMASDRNVTAREASAIARKFGSTVRTKTKQDAVAAIKAVHMAGRQR